MTIEQLQADLDATRTAIRAAVQAAAINIVGSHSHTSQTLTELRRHENSLMARIRMAKGYGRRVIADFSASDGNSNRDPEVPVP